MTSLKILILLTEKKQIGGNKTSTDLTSEIFLVVLTNHTMSLQVQEASKQIRSHHSNRNEKRKRDSVRTTYQALQTLLKKTMRSKLRCTLGKKANP